MLFSPDFSFEPRPPRPRSRRDGYARGDSPVSLVPPSLSSSFEESADDPQFSPRSLEFVRLSCEDDEGVTLGGVTFSFQPSESFHHQSDRQVPPSRSVSPQLEGEANNGQGFTSRFPPA